MWENAYLSIKIPKASRAHLRPQIAHFAHVTPLHYVGNFWPGAHLDQILDPHSLADLGGCARRAPPHLPGILVFDDILGHIV